MADLGGEYVTWDQVVELARKIDRGEGGDAALSSRQLAHLVVQFHEQTVGAPSSRAIRTPARG